MVTVYDVAARAGVSIATVSRALNDRARISGTTRERILRIAADLGYEPNEIARSLTGKASRTVALLLPDIANPFFPELVSGVQSVTDANEHLLLLCRTSDDEQKVVRDLSILRRKQVDGVILVAGSLAGGPITEQVPDFPLVLMDRDIPVTGADLVAVDHRRGARLAVEHLLDLGHRSVAHIAGPPGLPVSRARRAGWRAALRSAGLVADTGLIRTGDFLEDGGYRATKSLLAGEAEFTAIFAANDLTAIGALAALSESGIDVPGRMSVVGFDGIHLAKYTAPTLTTVAQPIFELGRRATELLLDRLTGERRRPEKVVLDTELIVRGSSGPPSDGSRQR
ncbi:MAG TPA: LacI family DNA-binding transcriptional regulator [Mycobacteriales bacterium]|nr:LacI family DNA-binding transcriptional regulator [Mycobacteriales bacterium]